MFILLIKILSVVQLKHSSFWPSAEVIPMPNDLVDAIAWQCLFGVSISILL
jgi:hypothetical protein